MGVFSRLFGGSAQNDRSYVRSWAEKRQRELRYSNDLSRENLFAAMMYGLSSFGKKDMRRSTPSELKGLGFDASEHYSGDAALFELGCYMYFRLDLWLYQHKPHHREDISTTFADKFTELFTQALNSKDIPALFDQRISQYAKLARTGADAEKYHYHLSQLILHTKDNQPPKSYDFENEPVMITGIFEDMGVKIALAGWEKGMIPALIKTLEKYCDIGDGSDELTDVTALREAAEQGDAYNQRLLAVRYHDGKGVQQDHKEAAKWYKKAAEGGDLYAQFELGRRYYKGEGLTQDYKEAIKLVRKVVEEAKGGDAEAQLCLTGVCIESWDFDLDPPDFSKKAAMWFREAGEHSTEGDVEAQYFLGLLYDSGINSGFPDEKKVTQWFKKVAKQGLVPAQHLYTLGEMYYEGQGVRRDFKEAVRFFKKAAEQGLVTANDRLRDFKPEFLNECIEEADPE